MSRTRLMAGSCFAMVLTLLAWGCAGTASKAVPFNATTGVHPTTWIQDHWAEYVKAPAQCRTCHGSTDDPAQAGGISGWSCFKCHTAVNHPDNWALPTQHGRLGAQAAPNAANPMAMVGFAHCAKCHGSTFDNGLTVSCKSCHTTAPHPVRPWTGKTVGAPSHVQTDLANAVQCDKCHTAGASSTLKPLITAADPLGTAPGCFNNTLCHGTNIKR